ncbi:MAG: host specificity factor TipJ family phage tail protein, partial [Hylemonella sp.]
ASFLQRHGVVPGQQWVVSLGGVQVPETHWGRVRPKHGHLIEARRVPQNDVLRIVAIAVIAYYTMGAGSGWMAGAGITGAAAYAVGAVLFYAGASLVNRMLGPQRPDLTNPGGLSTSPTYSLGGGRNRMRQFEPMGVVLGQPYCVPDLAAQPYTYFANGEQYLWQLFHAGINCASVDTLRIGQTAMGNYQDVSLSYEGFASGNTGLPMLSNVDVVAGALLDAPSGPGPWVTRTSSVNAMELAVDLEGTVFSLNRGNGSYQSLTCLVQIEYRLVGAPSWDVFYVTPPYTVTVEGHWEFQNSGEPTSTWVPGYTYTFTPTNLEITNANTRPVRVTYRRQVAAGQYEVRARKVSANVTASNQQNTIQWSMLKTYQLDEGSYKGQSRLGVQIKASGQLNGSLDEVNWQSTAKPQPYWNGSAWVTATNRENGLCNPGALILLLARGIRDVDGKLLVGLGRDDAQIDIDSLKLFMVWCAAKGFTYDYFLQENISIGDLLDSIAQAGLGSISYHTGKLGVIWFSDEQPVECVLNMATTKVSSFSVDYATMATADELEVQYFDRNRGNAWKTVRVRAPGVTTPLSTARLPLRGVTTEGHAAIIGRFLMAQNVYQRKTVSCDVDLEHLTFRRGTVLALSHDLTQWGYGGRVQAAVNSAGIVTLHLDDVVPAAGPGGASRYVGLRLAGESQYRIFPVQDFSGTSRTLTLTTTWPGGVPVPGDSAGNPAHDALWIYDFKSTPGQKLRVVEITPGNNMSGASVSLVPESDEFWSYVWTGAYLPPPNNTLLQGAPVVTGVTVTEQLGRQGNTYYTELTVTFDMTGSYERAELWGAIGFGPKQRLDSTRGLRMSWRGGLAETWLLEVRTFSSLYAGVPYLLSYDVKGLRAPPPNVTSFSLDGNRFTWDAVPDTPDLAGYQIRFNYGNKAWWENAQPLHRGFLTNSPYEPPQLPAGAVFLIKAFD